MSNLDESYSVDTYSRRGSTVLINKLIAHKLDAAENAQADAVAHTAEMTNQTDRQQDHAQHTPAKPKRSKQTQLQVSTLRKEGPQKRTSSVLTLDNGNLKPKQMSFKAVKRRDDSRK